MATLSELGRTWDEYFSSQNIDETREWGEIYSAYIDNLSDYGVIIPSVGTTQYYQLIYLYHHLGSFIPKDEIALYVISKLNNSASDQQTRQLQQKG